jgi:hypothetical protein
MMVSPILKLRFITTLEHSELPFKIQCFGCVTCHDLSATQVVVLMMLLSKHLRKGQEAILFLSGIKIEILIGIQ